MKYKILLLLVVALVSVSASFAVLETDIDDSQTDVNAVGDLNTTYSDEEKGDIISKQRDWYSRNYENVGISEYLENHPYFDGANVDLPEDPFPYKDVDFRIIAYSENPHFELTFEKLSTFLDPAYQKALANNGVYDDGSIIAKSGFVMNIFGSNSNSTDTPLELSDYSNSPVVENTNTTNNNPIVSAGMESTGLPIVALILAALVSIVAFRRKE